MPHPLFIALIASLCFAFTTRAEDKASPAVKKILDKAVAGIKANRLAFDKANETPLSEARQELQELAKTLVDEGKADDATAVLAQVKTLDADLMRLADASAPVAGGAGSRKPLMARLAGKWTHPKYNYVMCFAPDGSFQQQEKGGGIVARGQARPRDADMTDVILDNGYRIKVMPAGGDFIAVLFWKPDGHPEHSWVFERIK